MVNGKAGCSALHLMIRYHHSVSQAIGQRVPDSSKMSLLLEAGNGAIRSGYSTSQVEIGWRKGWCRA